MSDAGQDGCDEAVSNVKEEQQQQKHEEGVRASANEESRRMKDGYETGEREGGGACK